MDLYWSKGFSFEQLLTDPSLKERYRASAGVYVHLDGRALSPDGGGQAAYVGKASGEPSLWIRQYQHYVNTIGGLCVIPDGAGGYQWMPGYKSSIAQQTVVDEDKFVALVRRAFDYAKTVRVHLCALKSADDAKSVERELLYVLRPADTDWGKVSPPAERLALVHHCAEFPFMRGWSPRADRAASWRLTDLP